MKWHPIMKTEEYLSVIKKIDTCVEWGKMTRANASKAYSAIVRMLEDEYDHGARFFACDVKPEFQFVTEKQTTSNKRYKPACM